jgi:hypothetical protein
MINGSVGARTVWKSSEIAEQLNLTAPNAAKINTPKYSVIQKEGLDFVRLYFLNYRWYVNDLHNI